MNTEKIRKLVQKSYNSMKGSHCLEEDWLKEVLILLAEKPPTMPVGAISLLKEIYGAVSDYGEFTKPHSLEFVPDQATKEGWLVKFNKALLLLQGRIYEANKTPAEPAVDTPKCGTCGGTKIIGVPYQPDGEIDLILCPDCTGQKEGEFTIEGLSAKFHEIYQTENKRQGTIVRHSDNYNELSENTKEYDRVLARYVLNLIDRLQTNLAAANGKNEKKDVLIKWLLNAAGNCNFFNEKKAKEILGPDLEEIIKNENNHINTEQNNIGK